MYIPKLYRNHDLPEVEKFLQQHSFAALISFHEGRHWATHLPLELEVNAQGEKVLWGHLSRANPQWKSFTENRTVMAIFTGPHAYISASWYDHVNVPTWNYMAVHVYGKVKLLEGEQLQEALRRLVNKYEMQSENPVSVDTMPKEFLQKEMKGVVGFEISIDSMEAAWKLSQNRDDANYSQIIAELEKLNSLNASQVADEMKKLRP